MFKENLLHHINDAKNSLAYKNYLTVLDGVLTMLDNEQKNSGNASFYWREELAGFDYMLDASPLIINKLRHHCYHITGIRDYDYREHHGRRAAQFEQKLKLLQNLDGKGLFVPESPILGGFGYAFSKGLCNLDTLKFYEVLIGMDKAGFLEPFRKNERRSIIEIGSGWGGFAYQFKTLFPNTTYVLVDLPQSFIFAGTYLKTLFPLAKCLFLTGANGVKKDSLKIIPQYDFIFIPHFLWKDLDPREAALAVNMVSFQEMTTAQVDEYAKNLALAGVNIYSLNRDRSPNNQELSTISGVLDRYCDVSEVRVLDEPYHQLKPNEASPLRKAAKAALLALGVKKHARGIGEYRHLAGAPKTGNAEENQNFAV